jgi:hypothetical protein
MNCVTENNLVKLRLAVEKENARQCALRGQISLDQGFTIYMEADRKLQALREDEIKTNKEK